MRVEGFANLFGCERVCKTAEAYESYEYEQDFDLFGCIYCVAFVLYDYAPARSATDELGVLEGETVRVVEIDDGSGWTTVQSGSKKGVVPTSYIEPAPPIFSAAAGALMAPAAESGVEERGDERSGSTGSGGDKVERSEM
ncbi:hypothetical protein HK097_002068, partial [Rhizophlyctis rosea]